MSQENVEVVRGAYEAFAEGDLGAVLNAFDPEVVSYTAPPSRMPLSTTATRGAAVDWKLD